MQEERRLAAIMFSDICGFSKTMGENEERAIAFASMHRDCIQSGTEIHGGRIIKEMGDGMLVEFSSAVNAVRCAVAVQKGVAKYNRTAVPEEQFHLRIGIHVGDVVVTGDDILGDGVNVASRIEPLAEPGGICISRDIFDLVRNKISIETVHLGAHDLKNISQQISIYKVLVDAVAPVKTIKQPPPRHRQPLFIIAVTGGAVFLALLMLSAVRNRQEQQTVAIVQAESSEQDEISENHIKFMKAVLNKDRDSALSYVPPNALIQGDADKIWNKLSFMAFMVRLGKITQDDIRVKYVHITEDGTSADVIMQILRKVPTQEEKIWQDSKPLKWIKLNGSWYVDVPSPKPPDQRQNPKGRRPPRPGGTSPRNR